MRKSKKHSTRNAGKNQFRKKLKENEVLVKVIDFEKYPHVLTVNGSPVYALDIESIHSRKYVDFHSIREDLTQCIDALMELKNLESKISNSSEISSTEFKTIGTSLWALSAALVVTYCKCFNSSTRITKIGIEWIDDEYIELHKYLLDLRDAHVAHAGGTWESSVSLVAFNPSQTNKKTLAVHYPYSVRNCALNPSRFGLLNELLVKLKEKVIEKEKAAFEKHKEVLRSKDIDFYYSHLIKFKDGEDVDLKITDVVDVDIKSNYRALNHPDDNGLAEDLSLHPKYFSINIVTNKSQNSSF